MSFLGWHKQKFPSPVVWTSIVNCVASGNDLTKNAGGSAWNAGAVSVAVLTADGYVEFSAGVAGYGLACGLSVGSMGESYAEIDYAILLIGAGSEIIIDENGEYIGTFGVWTLGDLYRIQRIGEQITYWRKPLGGSWSLLYTSLAASIGDLLVDCSIVDVGDAITDAVLYAGG